ANFSAAIYPWVENNSPSLMDTALQAAPKQTQATQTTAPLAAENQAFFTAIIKIKNSSPQSEAIVHSHLWRQLALSLSCFSPLAQTAKILVLQCYEMAILSGPGNKLAVKQYQSFISQEKAPIEKQLLSGERNFEQSLQDFLHKLAEI